MGALIKVCPARRLNLGSKFSRMVTYYVAGLLISVWRRKVKGLNVHDTYEAVATSSKQLLSKCEDL